MCRFSARFRIPGSSTVGTAERIDVMFLFDTGRHARSVPSVPGNDADLASDLSGRARPPTTWMPYTKDSFIQLVYQPAALDNKQLVFSAPIKKAHIDGENVFMKLKSPQIGKPHVSVTFELTTGLQEGFML